VLNAYRSAAQHARRKASIGRHDMFWTTRRRSPLGVTTA
jgi:hypothetical protein